MDSIIQIENVRKSFSQKAAIHDVNFTVKQGEIFGMLGPSGAGKTTIIKLLTGELCKTAGDINVLNLSPGNFTSASYKSKIGILSDHSALYERLTVYDNLKLFCKLYGAPLQKIDDILDQMNMKDAKNETVSKVSRGMKQRVLLAKSIIHQPELVFLDEPTSALDPANVVQVHRTLRLLNEAGTTIFLNTHDMEEATVLCDRVAFLCQGVIQEIDTPENLRYKYSTGAFHIRTYDEEQLVIKNDAESASEITHLIKSDNIKEMYTDKPTLGQIFLEITGKELV